MTTASPETLVNRLWWLTLLRGLVSLALGVLAIFWPGLTISALLMLFGFFSIIDGVIALGTGIVFRRTAWGWEVVHGIAGIVIGVLALRYPQTLAAVIVIFFAMWALVIGLVGVATAIQLRAIGQRSWGWALAWAIVVALLGLYFLVNPDAGATFWAVTIGVFAVIAGVVLVFGAFQLRRAKGDLAALFSA